MLQKIVRSIYPLRMKLSETTGMGKRLVTNMERSSPPVPFYGLQATLNSGSPFLFGSLKGKYVLIVNTASNCGYTRQYEELETLYQQHRDKLVVLGFPSNDFGAQEPGTDQQIATFCQLNYGVTFPLFEKGPVKGTKAQPVFQWLGQPGQNGWNAQQPIWNFSKYLIDPTGMLIGFYSSAVSPLGGEIADGLK